VAVTIKDYLKASGNGTEPGPYQERSLTHKAVDCLIKSVVKKALIQKRVHPHVMRHTLAVALLDKRNNLKTRAGPDGPLLYQDHGTVSA
jgi:site-specific recombinase XerC